MLTITDVSNWTDVAILINANENTIAWYTFYNQQLLQDHIASYSINKTFRTCYLYSAQEQNEQ